MLLYKITLLFNYIFGIKTHSEIYELVGFKRFGTELIYAGGITIGIFSFILIIIGNFLKGLFGIDGKLSVVYFFVMGLISFFLCFYSVFKKDKYLYYFEYFDRKSSAVRKVYFAISLISVMVTFYLLIYSFRF